MESKRLIGKISSKKFSRRVFSYEGNAYFSFIINYINQLKQRLMQVSIYNLWAVAYVNGLTNKIVVHSKLFASKEEADNYGKEFLPNSSYSVSPVFFNNKIE